MSALLAAMQSTTDGDMDSRATSPGPGTQEQDQKEDLTKVTRSRPRTYPYASYLPYAVESETQRQADLEEILSLLYVSIEAGDFAVGALHWTRVLRTWLDLKFDPTKDQRIRLARLYYHLALAPGIDSGVSEKFAGTFCSLLKRKHYLTAGVDLVLDWRPLFAEVKAFVMPSASGMVQSHHLKRNYRTLNKMCSFAQQYFDPQELPAMLEEILPYFTTSFVESAFVVGGMLNLFLPTLPAPKAREDLLPQQYLPALFHIWSLVNRSKTFDVTFIDLFSRLARDHLRGSAPFSEFGIFTGEQSSTIFTAILRLLDIPVGQATSPYSATLDHLVGLAICLERDHKKHPVTHNIARWIIMSLSPEAMDKPNSIMTNLEGLVQAVETFFHPSNSGSWTRTLAQLVYYLADFFLMRWNHEHHGETDTPEPRKLNDDLKRRFVVCLRDVVFMGIYSKSGTAMDYNLSTLRALTYLEPSLILPGALQRIYPSMQGLVEVHRTTSSLRALQSLSRSIVRTKGFRCHITTLLGLALPGIDANDLDKTIYTLSFIQSVAYNIPFHDLTKGREDVNGDMLAMGWIAGEVSRMDQEGTDVRLDYNQGLSDQDEEMILRSSTTGFPEFLTSFLGRVFTLLENLPDAQRNRTGSAEENVVNTLPATFIPLLAALSPELFDIALNKIADFIANHVIHQARDAMAFICGSLAKTNPQKTLKRLVPALIGAIRTEIDENGAASTRNQGNEVLPRDRGLVWSVSMLSMSVVHVGDALMPYRRELFDIALYMQQKCQGTPTLHVSNFSHHLLLSLTGTYTIDNRLYEPDVISRGIGPQDWGMSPDPQKLHIAWHVPKPEECLFALDVVLAQGGLALRHLRSLLDGSSGIKQDGAGKEWSDQVSRNLMIVRLMISGAAVLFNPRNKESFTPEETDSSSDPNSPAEPDADADGEEDDDLKLPSINDDEARPTFCYAAGYVLDQDDQIYEKLHSFREEVGIILHDVHVYLRNNLEDDVALFGPLYTTYRCWFTDVGIERSAKVLDRNVRLLSSDIHPFKVTGLRKEYPRQLLVRRALVYHLQRLKHNSQPRPLSELANRLLIDLAESSVGEYTEVRRQAQGAAEAAFKVAMRARSLLIPRLVDSFETSVNANNLAGVKGSLYSLLFSTLTRPIGRNWRYAPRIIKCFLKASNADRPSVQRMCTMATFSIMEMARPLERMAILDQDIVQLIVPKKDVQPKIDKKRAALVRQRRAIERKKAELSEELGVMARQAHWKQASRTGAIVVTLGMRFDSIASENIVELVTKGSIDEHPGLRGMFFGAFTSLLTLVECRAVSGHLFKNYLIDKAHLLAKVRLETERDDPAWTQRFLSKFAQPEADYYIDSSYPGWLVWSDTMPAFKSNPEKDVEHDESEKRVLAQIGSFLDREWYATTFDHLKQEPRDSTADQFHVSNALLLTYTFTIMYLGYTKANLGDIKEEVARVFGDGTDKHQHRATAEILAGLLLSTVDKPIAYQTEIWSYAFPIFSRIFADGLNPENVTYWNMFLHYVIEDKDPRRVWPVVDWLASYKLDIDSDAAFKESCKIRLLQQVVVDLGWHFQLEKPIIEDFMAHIDHPYKGVREAMGQTLASLQNTRYHESYKDVTSFMESQRAVSSLGVRPYEPSPELTDRLKDAFDRIEKWRAERPHNEQNPTSYTSGAKTVMLWIDSSLSSYECAEYIKFFPEWLEPLLHMMDVKEDPELQGIAYHVFRQIPNIPHRAGEDVGLIEACIRIGRSSNHWHQRLRVLINLQVIFFRRLFLLSRRHQDDLFDCVVFMLGDKQFEVREGASATLSGMIRCAPAAMRAEYVDKLQKRFTKMLIDNPLPKKPRQMIYSGALSANNSGTGTPSPEQATLALKRHSAVLGLGALVGAFPYASPPPKWIPAVLTTLARKANNDPGIVGKSVKSIMSEFKKTRQDTWQIDLKAFTPEQAEDLDGTLWKSYFA